MKALLVAAILTIISNYGLAFQDTITLNNGDSMYCTIHEYNQEKIKISTSFSKGDFWIKAAFIKELKSMSRFTFILSDGRRKLGFINEFNIDSVSIELESGQETFSRSVLVHFHQLKRPILDRIESSVDFSSILKKEKSYRQYLINAKAKYVNERMSFRFKLLISRVYKNNIPPIKRSFLLAGADYFMASRIYVESKIKILESTEQDLRFRFSFSNAIGIRFVSNAKIKGRASLGLSYNNERFNYNINTFNTYEIYSGIHLTLLKYKDLSIELSSHNYQSISKANRFRTDSELFFKYNLPKKIYLKSRFIFSYDGRPHSEIRTSDYIITNGIGWKF